MARELGGRPSAGASVMVDPWKKSPIVDPLDDLGEDPGLGCLGCLGSKSITIMNAIIPQARHAWNTYLH